MEAKEHMCSHCGKGGHDVEGCYKLIGYPEGWIFRDQAGRGRGNNRGRGNFRGSGRGAGRSTVGAGRSTVTGGRSEVHAVQGEGPSPLPNFEDLTSEQWNAARHALSLSPVDNSQKLSGETPREDASRSNLAIDYFEDAEELFTEDHMDRSWRNGRPPGNGDAEGLETVDLVDRAENHGRPSEGQNDGSSGEDSTVDRVMEDGRPFLRQKPDEPAMPQTVDPVDRSTDGGRPPPRQKPDEPAMLQTVDPVDRFMNGGRPSPSQQQVETLGRSQRERRPNVRLADYVTHVTGPHSGERCRYPLSSYVTFRAGVHKVFRSLSSSLLPISAVSKPLWSLTDDEVEKRDWNRSKSKLGQDNDNTICSSSFDGLFKRNRGGHPKGFGDIDWVTGDDDGVAAAQIQGEDKAWLRREMWISRKRGEVCNGMLVGFGA
ncbi:unnamed protein product [Cuscuta campestris]|uniref:Uncharacterized protein n=1 Tax=Cuscuta campestris TaxID=132261 RepID=A0A484K9R3_9ASTE|nr:unnamed protein product [Cuscuta campestris]